MRPEHYNLLLKFDMRRSPRWRYERVRSLLDSRPKRQLSRLDDEPIRRAWRFIGKWDRLARENRDHRTLHECRREMFPEDPPLYLAYQLFAFTDSERIRCEIESRILARQTNEEIADKLTTLPETIDIYEKLFFNVRDRLKNTGYIVNRILAPALAMEADSATPESSAKFFGYFAGPVVLDVVLTGFDANNMLPGAGEACDEFMDTHFGSTIRRRSAEVANTFEINKFNVMMLFETHAKLIETAKKVENEGEKLNAIETGMYRMMQALPWSVGKKRQEALEQSPLKPYYGNQAELRADEMLDVISEKPKLDLRKVRTLQVPERRSTSDDAVAHEDR